MAVLVERLNKYIIQYFEAVKAAKGLGKRLIYNDEFLAPLESFVQTETLDTITDQRMFDLLKSTFMTSEASWTQQGQQRPALCTKHRFVRVQKAQMRRATKEVSHDDFATVLAVEPTKTETTSLASWTLQCQ